MKARPNIVLITLESVRADFVGYQNPKQQNTPFLDRLAKESLVFTNTIVPGCPTFFHLPSLMTGKLPFAYGYKLGISDAWENQTIAEVLREHGYKTIAVLGDTPQLYSIYNFDRGFDIYLDGHERKSKEFMFWINTLWNMQKQIPSNILNILDYIRAAFQILSKTPPPHLAGETLNKIIMETLKHPQEPFFLWVHYMDAHFPYLSGIDKISGTLKKILYYKRLMTSVKEMKIDSPELVEQIKTAYGGGVQHVDQVIEKMYKFISIKYPNTIFIITSDHGEAFMEHGMFCHEALSLYDELIKVPLLIHLPSRKKKIISDVVSTVSIAKTICSLLHIEETRFDGSNLTKTEADAFVNHICRILYKCISPSIRFQIFDNETEILGFNELISYTGSTYKYIVEVGGKKEELYNLKNDPAEKKNLIRQVPLSLLETFRKKIKKIL